MSLSSFGFSSSSTRRSSGVDGPASARWPRSRVQSGSVRSVRASSARRIGSASASVSSESRIDLPLWMRSSCTPARSASSKYHGYLVAGHSAKPPRPARYGSSWQAPKKLGSAESGVRVRRPRARRDAAVSSRLQSARSGVSRSSYARRSSSSWRLAMPLVYSPRMAAATILTIGDELVSGDVANTNATWLARRLERLGVAGDLMAAPPDEIDASPEVVRHYAPRSD